MIYFDSSALVKRYLHEPGTDRVSSIIASSNLNASSKLAHPEVFSSFMRKYRYNELSATGLAAVIQRFEIDWTQLFVIEFSDDVLRMAKTIIQTHPLRAADAVHLASAVWLRESSRTEVTFVTADLNQIRASEREGLKSINPLE